MAHESLDLFAVDHLFTDEERLVRDTVRDWVRRRVLPHIEAWAWDGHFPRELVPEMARLNLFGATFREYGLPGLSNVGYGLVMQELERGDSGLRSFVSVQSALVMYPIMTWGSQEQKDHWIPLLARGEAIGCFGLTEPGTGITLNGKSVPVDAGGHFASAAAVTQDDPLNNSQSHAGAFIVFGTMQTRKHVKQFMDIFHIKSHPIVFDKIRALVVFLPRTDFDERLLLLAGEFKGVRNQVKPNLMQQQWVGFTGGQIAQDNFDAAFFPFSIKVF